MSPAAKGKSLTSNTNRPYQGKPIFPFLQKQPIEQTMELYGHHKNRSKGDSGRGIDHHNKSVEGLLYSKRKG